MKKLITLFIILCLALAMVGCGGSNPPDGSTGGTGGGGTQGGTPVTLEVTFKQYGQADIVKTVNKGENLTDIPTPTAIQFCEIAWDKSSSDFNNVNSSFTVNAVYTKDGQPAYILEFDLGDYKSSATLGSDYSLIGVKQNEQITLPRPTHGEHGFNYWVDGDGAVITEQTFTFTYTKNVVFTANWNIDGATSGRH